jgi:copper chaperone
MCDAHKTKAGTETDAAGKASVSFTVNDMTCGHCASTIKKAVETGLAGTQVFADPESKRVKITGSSDVARLKDLIAKAGYTPEIQAAA